MAWSNRDGRAWNKGSTSHHRTLRKQTLERDGYLCRIRGPHCTTHATIRDHIINLEAGGPDTLANSQAACQACNQWKAAREAHASRAANRATARHRSTRIQHPGLK